MCRILKVWCDTGGNGTLFITTNSNSIRTATDPRSGIGIDVCYSGGDERYTIQCWDGDQVGDWCARLR